VHRFRLTALAVLVTMWCLAATASAAECGKPGAAGGEPVVGKLSLDTQNTPLETLDFKDSTDPDGFQLVFVVSPCTITAKGAVTGKVRLKSGQAAFGKVVVSPKGNLLVVEVPVDHPDKFPAEVVKPVLTLSGTGTIESTALRLSMQRKEPMLWPALIALAAGLLGGLWALWKAYDTVKGKQKAGQKVRFNAAHVATTLFGGLIAGYAVYKSSYLDAATWKLGWSTALSLAIGVGAAAAGGAAVGASGAVALDTRRQKRKAVRRARAEGAGGAAEPLPQ
jgi:hypothetical protein